MGRLESGPDVRRIGLRRCPSAARLDTAPFGFGLGFGLDLTLGLLNVWRSIQRKEPYRQRHAFDNLRRDTLGPPPIA